MSYIYHANFHRLTAKERKSRSKGKKATAGETSDEDGGNLSENPLDEPAVVPTSRPKPRPLAQVVDDNALPMTALEDIEEEAMAEMIATPDLSTPTKVRPRPKATYRVKSPVKSTGLSDVNTNGISTPSRKRALPEGGLADETVERVDADVSLSREPTPTSDIQIRRKRVRH
jgi:hypothetical protein